MKKCLKEWPKQLVCVLSIIFPLGLVLLIDPRLMNFTLKQKLSPPSSTDVGQPTDRNRDNQDFESLVHNLKHHKDYDVRLEAAHALSRLGDKRAVSPLIDVLKNRDEDLDVFSAAALALSNLDPSSSVEVFIELLETLKNVKRNEDIYKRLYLMRVCARLEDPHLLPQLITALRDKEFQVRSIAAKVLRYFKPASVLEVLRTSNFISVPISVLPSERRKGSKVALVILDYFEGNLSFHGSKVLENARKILGEGVDVTIFSIQFVRYYQDLLISYHRLLDFVSDHPNTIFIVNISAGHSIDSEGNDPLLVQGMWPLEWIENLGKQSVVFVFAAGNENKIVIHAHPPLDNVLYITAGDSKTGQKGTLANYGPSEFIFLTAATTSGTSTSIAASVVSSMLAKLLSEDKTLSIPDAIRRIKQLAQPMPNEKLWNEEFEKSLLGAGILRYPAIEPSPYDPLLSAL